MLLFNQRRKLAELYKKWWLKNKVADCPVNVIGYLVGHGLINEEAALAFLERAEKEEVD